MTEKWLPIKGYERLYEVSNFGRVKSFVRKRIKILKNRKAGRGYFIVSLYNKASEKKQYVHRLVAEYFIPNPENKKTVNHKDGIKKNNMFNNLEWMTYSENTQHAVKNGLIHNRQNRKPVAQIKDGKVIKTWDYGFKAGKKLGINFGNISSCCHRKYGCKTAGGFEWKFV